MTAHGPQQQNKESMIIPAIIIRRTTITETKRSKILFGLKILLGCDGCEGCIVISTYPNCLVGYCRQASGPVYLMYAKHMSS